MHHPVCGINSRILSVSLAISHVSTHLLIHLSAHLYYHHHSHHPSLLHSFTPGSKPTFSTNPSHLRLLLPTGLPSWQWDWTGPIMLIILFLVSHFNFLFVPCGGLSCYPSAFYCTLNTHYRIISYRIQVRTLKHCWVLTCVIDKEPNRTYLLSYLSESKDCASLVENGYRIFGLMHVGWYYVFGLIIMFFLNCK